MRGLRARRQPLRAHAVELSLGRLVVDDPDGDEAGPYETEPRAPVAMRDEAPLEPRDAFEVAAGAAARAAGSRLGGYGKLGRGGSTRFPSEVALDLD